MRILRPRTKIFTNDFAHCPPKTRTPTDEGGHKKETESTVSIRAIPPGGGPIGTRHLQGVGSNSRILTARAILPVKKIEMGGAYCTLTVQLGVGTPETSPRQGTKNQETSVFVIFWVVPLFHYKKLSPM